MAFFVGPALAATATPGAAAVGNTALGIGTGIVAAFVASPFTIPYSQQISAAQTADVRATQYLSNKELPNLVPDLTDLGAMYWAGLLDRPALGSIGKNHGALLAEPHASPSPAGQRWRQNLWDRWLRLGEPIPDLDTIARHLYRAVPGNIPPLMPEQALERRGVAQSSWRNMILQPHASPPAGVVKSLLDRNIIDLDEAKRMLRAAGFTYEPDLDRMTGIVDGPSLGDIRELWNREEIGTSDAHQYMRWLGVRNERERRLILQLANRIPPYSDLVTMMIREVWDERTVREWGYDEGVGTPIFEPFHYWISQQGYGWSEDVTMPDGSTLAGKPWSQLLYRMHWRPMSPEQAFLAYQRFRPERLAKYQAEFPGLPAFSLDRLNQVLRIADHPPLLRPWLAALSRPPKRFVDIRAAIGLGVRNPSYARFSLGRGRNDERSASEIVSAWGVEEFRDRGYSALDAEFATDLFVRLAEEQVKGRDDRLVRRARDGLGRMYLSLADVGILPLDRVAANLRVLGWPDNAVIHATETARLGSRLRCIKAFLRRTKRQFTSGILSGDDAKSALLAAGLDGRFVRDEVECWSLSLGEGRKQLETSKILALLEKGLLRGADAALRLKNLGWQQIDLMLLLGESAYDIAVREARAAEAGEKNRLRAAREIERLQKELAAQKRSLETRLRRATPPTMLQRLLRKGRIGVGRFRQLMESMDYGDDDVNLWLADAGVNGTNGAGPEEPSP